MTSANGPVPAESGVCAATMNGAPSSHSRAGSSRLAEVTALADLFTAKGRAAMTSFRSRAPSPGRASSRQRTASSAASKNSVPRRVNPPPLHSQTGSGRSPLTSENAAAPPLLNTSPVAGSTSHASTVGAPAQGATAPSIETSASSARSSPPVSVQASGRPAVQPGIGQSGCWSAHHATRCADVMPSSGVRASRTGSTSPPYTPRSSTRTASVTVSPGAAIVRRSTYAVRESPSSHWPSGSPFAQAAPASSIPLSTR